MADLEIAFRNGVRDIARAQAEGASSVVVSVDRVNRGVDALQGSLSDVGTAIGALCTSIDSGFSELSYHMRMQSGQLMQILEVLQAPLDTQSKELRNRAQDAYRSGWIDDAESDFLESVELNRYDFTLHQGLGNIAFFHRSDPEKARDYFNRAAKYAGPKSPPDAAVAYISLAAVAETLGDFPGALDQARLALQACSDLGESHYVVAKYTSATGGSDDTVVDELFEAFTRRVALALWADRDPILGQRRGLLDAALVRFRDYLRADVQERLDTFGKWQQAVAFTLEQTPNRTADLSRIDSQARELQRECVRLQQLDTIFDLHDAQQILLRGLPELLQKGADAARSASAQLTLDTNSNRYAAQSTSNAIKEARGWFIVGGLAVGLFLGLLLGLWTNGDWFTPVVIGGVVGGVVGLVTNLVMTSQAKAFTDHTGEASALNDLGQKLWNGLQALPQEQAYARPNLMFAPNPRSAESVYV